MSGFKPSYVSTFMGGEFDLGKPRTVGELKVVLEGIISEIDGWGPSETELCEFEVMRDRIIVSLKEGIVQ